MFKDEQEFREYFCADEKDDEVVNDVEDAGSDDEEDDVEEVDVDEDDE